MTDDELLRLLAEKSPREFTPEEVARLRERMRSAPAIRAALQDAVQFEGELQAALGRVSLSVEHLLGRVEERARRPTVRHGGWWRWGGLIGLTSVLLIGLLAWRMGRPSDEPGGSEDAVVTRDDGPAESTDDIRGDDPSAPAAADMSSESAVEFKPPDPPLPQPIAPMPTPDEPVAAAPPAGPWVEWLTPQAEPLRRATRAWRGDLPAMEMDQLTKSTFEAWWQAIPGLPLGVQQDQIAQRATVNVDGWAQLKAPWVADTALRFVPFDQRDLTLYFWRGTEGLALKFYRDREPRMWAIFRVTRVAGEREPNAWGLLTTDGGTYHRSGAELWDVAITEGRLQLSVGDVPLLSVPTTGLPDEVYLQAQTRLRGFRWVRVEPPAAVAIREPGTSVLPSAAPADWDWRLPPDGAMMLQRQADGGVLLTSTSKTDLVKAFVPLERPGLYATLIQVAAADPGTGVYLGDERGEPLGVLGFARDRSSQQLTYAALRPNERREESDYQRREFPPPYFVPGQWLRVVTGLGTWHTSCGADLAHLGYLAENPLRDVHGSIRTIGLICWPAETPRSIELRSARVERLPGLEAWGHDRLPIAPPLGEVARLRFDESWWTAGWERITAEADPARWWRSFALTTLEHGPHRELADHLVTCLVETAHRELPPPERWRVFDDLLALSDHWHDDRSARWEREYARIGREQLAAAEAVPARALWRQWLESPVWAYRGHRQELMRWFDAELLTQVGRRDWDRADATASTVRTWLALAHPDQQPRDQAQITDRLARWSLALAGEQPRDVGTGHEGLPPGWRHPLQPPVNKEAYNIHEELLAALDAGDYADAARVVEALDPTVAEGLVPDAIDPELWVSLEVALSLATATHPPLATQLATDLTPTGWLQFKQAELEGDAAAMDRVVWRNWGTAPANLARIWQGDRALAAGDPLTAWLRYRAAANHPTGMLPADLAARWPLLPRLTLAGGLIGLAANPASSAETLAGQSIATVLSQRGGPTTSPATPMSAQPPTDLPWEPRRYQWEQVARFDGQAGQNAGQGQFRDSDPFGRQFAITVDAERVYLSNRFQVTAYPRAGGPQVWAQAVGSEQGQAHGYRFQPARPVVSGSRLYVRRLTKAGMELAALDVTNGNVVWTARPGDKAEVLSDPVVIGASAWALVGTPTDQDQLELSWIRFATADGRVEATTPLLRLRDAWEGQVPTMLAVVPDDWRMVATVGGVCFAFDLGGNVTWLRRETWLPSVIDPLYDDHWLSPPVFQNGAAYLTIPQSRRVLALDPDTGRARWSAVLADLQGLASVTPRELLVWEREGLAALDPDSGAIRWRSELLGLLGPISVTEHAVWVPVVRHTRGRRGWVQLLELDRATGVVRREAPWELPEADDWRFGPWWRIDERLWGLATQGWNDPHRHLVRLSPVPDTTSAPPADPLLGAWVPQFAPEFDRELERLLPGWRLYGVPQGRLKPEAGDVRGESGVLIARGEGTSQIRLAQTIPAEGARLELRVGQEPGHAVLWQVRVAGTVVFEQQSPAEGPPWATWNVALPASPTPRLVEILATSPEKKAFTTTWKRLTLLPP